MRRAWFAVFAACAIVTVAASGGPAAAQGGASGPLKLSLGYDGRLLFKVLDMQIEEQVGDRGFGASVRLTSAGILAAFKHVDERAMSQGRLVRGEPQPGRYEYQNLAGKTHRKVTTVWTDGDVDMRASPPFKDLGDPPATRAQALAAADPLTQLMRVTLNATRDTICRRTYRSFDGKQLYEVAFSAPSVTAVSPREAKLGLVNHVRCDAHYRPLAGFGKKKPGEAADRGPERPILVDFAQVSENGPWVISAIHGQTPLGWAAVELTRMTISGGAPAR